MGVHDGHRLRLIEKLDTGSLQPHEELEMLLFNAVPRRNTNDLAHRLLAEFGSMAGVLSASVEELQRVKGIGPNIAAYLRCIGKFVDKHVQSEAVEERLPLDFSVDTFLPFVKRKYSKIPYEVFDLYFLDGDNCLVDWERFSQEDFSNVEIEPERVSEMLMKYAPAGLVVVHNHPIGKAEPSEEDDALTLKMQLLCNIQNILFCDHVIYAPNGVYSYYCSGTLKDIAKEYALENILAKGKRGGQV